MMQKSSTIMLNAFDSHLRRFKPSVIWLELKTHYLNYQLKTLEMAWKEWRYLLSTEYARFQHLKEFQYMKDQMELSMLEEERKIWRARASLYKRYTQINGYDKAVWQRKWSEALAVCKRLVKEINQRKQSQLVTH